MASHVFSWRTFRCEIQMYCLPAWVLPHASAPSKRTNRWEEHAASRLPLAALSSTVIRRSRSDQRLHDANKKTAKYQSAFARCELATEAVKTSAEAGSERTYRSHLRPKLRLSSRSAPPPAPAPASATAAVGAGIKLIITYVRRELISAAASFETVNEKSKWFYIRHFCAFAFAIRRLFRREKKLQHFAVASRETRAYTSRTIALSICSLKFNGSENLSPLLGVVLQWGRRRRPNDRLRQCVDECQSTSIGKQK